MSTIQAKIPPSFPMAKGINEVSYTNNVHLVLKARIAQLKGETLGISAESDMLPSPMYGAGTENLITNND